MLLPAKTDPKAWKAAVEVWPKEWQEEREKEKYLRDEIGDTHIRPQCRSCPAAPWSVTLSSAPLVSRRSPSPCTPPCPWWWHHVTNWRGKVCAQKSVDLAMSCREFPTAPSETPAKGIHHTKGKVKWFWDWNGFWWLWTCDNGSAREDHQGPKL